MEKKETKVTKGVAREEKMRAATIEKGEDE